MDTAQAMTKEWQRIALLGFCLEEARKGNVIGDEIRDRIKQLNDEVQLFRKKEPWKDLILSEKLSAMDQDILVCAMAAYWEPKIGWLYAGLQPGVSSHFPTPALLQELLFMEEEEAGALRERTSSGGLLRMSRLIEAGDNDIYQPIRPGSRALDIFGGKPVSKRIALPGAIEVRAVGEWDDLVLPTNCLKMIREFLAWIIHREKVMGEWGAQWVGGPVALFAGPSGTGKTFAAGVLANTLGWPLFRVDLGMLVSKYIGETEKNLNLLFDAAQDESIVLLFDEADSLFGKRSEIKDARDRYANMEVSHLLSRIERHDGPCILTTNLRMHIDPAFARRFQVVVEFPKPEASSRVELWKKYLPPRARYHANVKPELLAEVLHLTGGQIKNAALHAAFLAVDDGLEEISLHHIARSIRSELAKEGREVQDSSLGRLIGFLKEGQC